MKYTHIVTVCLLLLLGMGVKAQETTFWKDDFESHKGWILDAGLKEFQIAKPRGGNGDHGYANPTSGYNSNTALVSNLGGAYANDLTEREYQAISPEIDCSGKSNISLKYMRWLNVEQNAYDNAYIDVYDGAIWHEKVWSNGSNTIEENSWTAQSIDISHLVDGKDKVRIRFTLGPTDGGWYFSGWNIDNVELTTTPDPVYGDFRTRDNRNWSGWWQEYNGGSWDWTRNGPGETRHANVVTIHSGHRTTMNQNRPVGGYEIKNLIVEGGGTLWYTDGNTRRLTLTGSVTGSGTIDMSAKNLAHSLTVGGDFVPGILQQGRATVVLNGSSTQKVGSHTYYNLTVSGGGDKALQGDITINGTLNLNGAKIILGDHDLIIADGASIAGTFSANNMIVTNGAGRLIKQGNANADYNMVYPVGTGTYYTPYKVSSFVASDATGSLEVRAVAGAATGLPAAGAKDLQKHWVVSQTGLTVTKANVSFTYNNNEVGTGGNQGAYALRKASGGMWAEPGGTSTSTQGSNPMTASEVSGISGIWTAIEQPATVTYYSYKSGKWNDVSTWTHNPGGTTHTATDIPGDNARVVILNGRTVTLTSDVTNKDLSLAIGAGGFVDMSTHQFTNTLTELGGEGTLKLASDNFPTVTDNYLVTSVGGTVEYYNASNFILPSVEVEYNNLVLSGSGIATQKHNLTVNGNLHVKKGTYRINDNSNVRRQLTIGGNVTIASGASLTVGTGNTVSGDVNGGTAPFADYYDKNTHRLVVNGDFINKGTVRLTNQGYPVYNAFPTNGAATVYFRGANDNKLTCDGTTDLYNLVLDKGIDQTFKLTVYSSAYNNFRLFGRNNHSGEGTGANPIIKKALWVRTGTLELTGLLAIPSLSEGNMAAPTAGSPNADYYLPANGCLLLNGPDVIVLVTANNYAEVNAAYGLSEARGETHGVINRVSGYQAFSIYGKLQVNDGYISTRYSAGLVTWTTSSAEFIINGGHVDTRQLRSVGTSALSSYSQSGGLLTLRGRRRLTDNPTTASDICKAGLSGSSSTSNLDNSRGVFSSFMRGNVFVMSGGEIEILDHTGNGYAFDVASDKKNINVSGGTISIKPQGTSSDNYMIRSNAPFYNFAINNPGSGSVELKDYSVGGVNIAGERVVLNDLILTDGILKANNHDVVVGGNFSLASGTNYVTGSNRTIFNGDDDQELTVNLTSVLELHKLLIDKNANELLLKGSQGVVNVSDSLIIQKGTLNCDTKNVTARGHLFNNGKHIGTGKIVLSGVSISGNGAGQFSNLELNNDASNISMTANMTINGTLTFSKNRLLDIGKNKLTFTAGASIANAGVSRYIKTAGNAGDGGLTFVYDGTTAKQFPLGVNNYTPASIGFTSAPVSYGDITIIPVNYEHPTTTTDRDALSYFWRVKSNGFTGIDGKVTHQFIYHNDNIQGSESDYRPARYDVSSFTWEYGKKEHLDDAHNTIKDWDAPTKSADYIIGDYTAGLSKAFGTPKKYFSRQSGRWNQTSTWSTTSHTAGSSLNIPGAGDIVIIGKGHTVSLERDSETADHDKRSCASLQIETGGVLDATYNPGSNFGMVMSHPSGNGKIRISVSDKSGSIFQFPSGDFSDFNANLGTTELYTNNATGGTTYWLPDGVKEYGNLMISPLGGSNIIFPNNDVTILGDLTAKGQDSRSWYCPTWNSNYPLGFANRTRQAKTITIKGNFDLQGGALIYFGNNALAQNFVVDGDLIVSEHSGVKVYSNATNQSFTISGDLVNNSRASDNTEQWLPGEGWVRPNVYRGANFEDIPLIFNGTNNAKITQSAGVTYTTYTNIETLTVNKGASQATTLTMNISGTVNYESDTWLKLNNGTFIYNRNVNASIYSQESFTIPASAGLTVNTSNSFDMCRGSNGDEDDVYLNGKMTIINGTVRIGDSSQNRNNDIEYSGGGASEIEIQGGSLYVNGQVRRNPASSAGILKYKQSGGDLTINGRNALATNAKLEVLNSGSQFDISGGTITIMRGGGTTYGDLYLRPANSTVTGGKIIFTNTGAGLQNYLLDANIALNDLTINGSSNNATVRLLLSALTLKGDLTLSNTHSILDANSTYNIPITLKGDFNNSGTYSYHKNTTTFSGGTQAITGSTLPGFYNLVVNPVTSLTINNTVTVNNDLSLSGGTLAVGANAVHVKRNVVNNATYTSTGDGLVLNGSKQQDISGTGTFGRIELDNDFGAKALSNLSIEGNLALNKGVLHIGAHLLALSEHSTVEDGSGATNFDINNMVTTNGVYSSKGVQKTISAGASSFTFPIGVAGKYTPATLETTTNANVATIRINAVNDKHPAHIDAANILDYFWEVQSVGLDVDYRGELKFKYLDVDINGDDVNYYATRLLVPGTSWSKKNTVDDGNNTIEFTLAENNISGEYTAGSKTAFPDKVPQYTSQSNGPWSVPSTWVQTAGDPYTLTGGPNGFIVLVNHDVTITKDYAQAYKTTIGAGGKLKIKSTTYGHDLGEVSGSGTLYMESGQLPEAKYDNFLGCGHNATLEYGGSSDYALIADLYNEVANLIFSGTGKRILPDKDLTICNELIIRGAIVDNSVNNRRLFINGSLTRESGGFISGTGSNATVSFNGSAEQNVGGFTGVNNQLNNLEVNNSKGLTLTDDVEVAGKLLLTNGLINTTDANSLTITNTAADCVTPAAGSSTSYVNGPLTKKMNQSDSFRFPVGANGKSGGKLVLSAVRTGTKLWTVNYKRPNPTSADFSFPLTAINSHEYWSISTPGGGEAKVQLGWDADSDITPLMTEHGLTDIRVVNFQSSEWRETASVATGNNTNGSVVSNNRLTVPVIGLDVTTATVNTNKPKVRLNPDATICGLTTGIKVEMSSTVPTAADYELSYTINGVAQTPVTVTGFPFQLPTPSIGVYQLTGFKYDNKLRIGVVDPATIEVFESPTTANAGADQILQGKTQATLSANNPSVGVGRWQIVSGGGGSFVNPNDRSTVFNGTTGTTYVLSWTISNGDCESVDEVTIGFPVVTSHKWLGHTNEWNVGSNWEHGILPDASTDVIINAVIAPNVDPVVVDLVDVEIKNLTINTGATLTLKPGSRMTVNGNITTNDNNLIIENTPAKPSSFINKGTIADATSPVDGNILVKWQYPEKRWWYLGLPVTEFTLGNFGTLSGTGKNAIVYTHASRWGGPYTDPTKRFNTPMTGYGLVVKAGNENIDYSGNLNNNSSYSKTLVDRWQMIANPYTSYYNLQGAAADFANTTGSVYGYTGPSATRTVYTYNVVSGIGTGTNHLVAPSQGFWVKKDTDGEVFMRQSRRVHDVAKTGLKSGSADDSNTLRLKLNNGKAEDEAVIAFRSNGSDLFTRMDSEKKFDYGKEVSGIYSYAAENKTVINVLAEGYVDSYVQLGYKPVGGSHELRIEGIESLTESVEVILEDTYLNTKTLMTAASAYTFEASADEEKTEQRFILRFESKDDVPTGIDDQKEENGIKVYVSENTTINIACEWPDNKKRVLIYNVNGRLLSDEGFKGQNYSKNTSFKAGIYIVKIFGGDNSYEEKVVIK